MLKELAAVLIAACPAAAQAGEGVSDLAADEVIEFFPTFGWLDRDEREVCVLIRGWVYEPSRVLGSADFLLGLAGVEGARIQDPVFRERAGRFLVDNESNKQIVIRLAGKTYALNATSSSGHTETMLRVPNDWPNLATGRFALAVDFEAVLPAGDARKFTGRVHLIPPAGVSVISDIDDTIKISQVRDKKALLENTFFREFEPVAGMSEVYQTWHRDGAAFHYVTASPWQLFAPLEAFRQQSGFPPGTFHMKYFRLKDSSIASLFGSPLDYKRTTIEPILKTFPNRRFVLVGDGGEQDPEAYAALARNYPDQILRIFIRDVTGRAADWARYAQCFQGLAPDRWMVFANPDQIAAFRP